MSNDAEGGLIDVNMAENWADTETGIENMSMDANATDVGWPASDTGPADPDRNQPDY